MATQPNPNAKATVGNGLGPRTQIISATVADQDTLDAAVLAMGAAGHTVAGIDGALAGTMHFALQGGNAVAAGSAFGLTVAEVCTFDDEAQNGGVTV